MSRVCGFSLTAKYLLGAQELNAAVENEDYATAAELRDTGCAGLIGWWHSRAENDPAGHLLRIAPDFGRYTAVMYTPRDFAELKVRPYLVDGKLFFGLAMTKFTHKSIAAIYVQKDLEAILARYFGHLGARGCTECVACYT